MNPSQAQSNLTLADLNPGEAGIVTEIHSQGPDRRRMMDLGILPGTSILAEFNSPLGDPVAYRVRGAMVALRLSQARQIAIKIENDIENDAENNTKNNEVIA